MGTRWAVVLIATVLAVSSVSVSCTALKGGGEEPRVAADHKIRIEYDATGTNKPDRIKVKKDNGSSTISVNRCTDTTDTTCQFGHPVNADGSPVLGAITASDGDRRDPNEVYFVSDAHSPGRTCVCYGNRCYCN